MIKTIKRLLEKNAFVKKIAVFLYSNTVIRYRRYKDNNNLLKHGCQVLETVDKVFSELNISYWLDFGTLLGAIRENDFIGHDEDIDVAMWLSDYTPDIQKTMEKYGFVKIKDITIDNLKYGYEESYIKSGVQVDIFFFTKINDKKAYYHDFIYLKGCSQHKTIEQLGGLVVREITLPIESIGYIDFKGGKYPVPIPTKEHLIGRYGENYMIKDTNWDIQKGNKESVRILKDKVGIVISYN